MRSLFVGESKKDAFILAVTSVDQSLVAGARRTAADLRVRGQNRVHFLKESPARRRAILTTFIELGLPTKLYVVRGLRDVDARASALSRLTRDLTSEVEAVVIERDETAVAGDRRVLYAAGIGDRTSYRHERAAHEPLLWVPDAIAWCMARGGEWRRRADPIIERIVDVR